MNAPDPVAAALARLNLPDPRAGTRPAGGVVGAMNLKVLPTAHLEALVAVGIIELEERRAVERTRIEREEGPELVIDEGEGGA